MLPVAFLSAALWMLLIQLHPIEASPTQVIRSTEPSSRAAATRRSLLLGIKRNRDMLPLPRFMDWDEYEESLTEKEVVVAFDRGEDMLPEGWRWDSYHTSSDVKQLLKALQDGYPSIASSFSIGESGQKRPLMAIKIGEAPKLSPGTPEVKLVGNMHGDEAAGCEMLLRLAWDLCRLHNTSSGDALGITELLRTTNVYILPTMNPDGYDANPRQRENSESKDLNREFPRLGPTAPRIPSNNDNLPPEIQAVTRWTLRHNFPLSANLHGGYLVANYPFDACDRGGYERDCETPEDPTPYRLAREVARLHPRMRNSLMFPGGIVRGSEWYPVLGGMQDWVWYATQGIELTLEVHEKKEYGNKYTERLRWLYLEWRDPLLRYLSLVHHSFQGKVVDEGTGEPLKASVAMIDLESSQTDKDGRLGRMTETLDEESPLGGVFTRVLTPGQTYCLQVKASSGPPEDSSEPHYGVLQMDPDAPANASSSISETFRLGPDPVVHFLGEASGWSLQRQEETVEQCKQLLRGYS